MLTVHTHSLCPECHKSVNFEILIHVHIFDKIWHYYYQTYSVCTGKTIMAETMFKSVYRWCNSNSMKCQGQKQEDEPENQLDLWASWIQKLLSQPFFLYCKGIQTMAFIIFLLSFVHFYWLKVRQMIFCKTSYRLDLLLIVTKNWRTFVIAWLFPFLEYICDVIIANVCHIKY